MLSINQGKECIQIQGLCYKKIHLLLKLKRERKRRRERSEAIHEENDI